MSAEETNATKQAALLQLKLSEEEWDRVRDVLQVLKVRTCTRSWI